MLIQEPLGQKQARPKAPQPNNPCRRIQMTGASLLLVLFSTFQSAALCAKESAARSPHTPLPWQELTEKRLLNLSSTINTRDLGGYTTTDKRRVKWGMLFRSDRLSDTTKEDREKIKALHLATVTDFRSVAERDSHPNRLPEQSPAIRYRLLPMADPAINVVELGGKVYSGKLTNAELLHIVQIREGVDSTEFQARWSGWLKSLAEPQALPQLFHCTAGKDRTGTGAALLLLTLGVPKEQVIEDFLLSNHYLSARIDQSAQAIQALSEETLDENHLRSLVGVSPNTLPMAFKEMEEKYGSIDNYIETGLRIDPLTRRKLQSLLLEPI